MVPGRPRATLRAVKIRARTGTRLVLAGIPGGAGWMVFSLVLGLLLTAGFTAFAARDYRADGFGSEVVMGGLGALFGQFFFWLGAVTLAVGREALELDKAPPAGRRGGRYVSRSPIVQVPRPFEFDLGDIHAVSLERLTERHPGGGRRGGRSEVEVCRARLLVGRPRRAVTLDETSNHRDARVHAVGRAVAEFLGVPVEEVDRRRERD